MFCALGSTRSGARLCTLGAPRLLSGRSPAPPPTRPRRGAPHISRVLFISTPHNKFHGQNSDAEDDSEPVSAQRERRARRGVEARGGEPRVRGRDGLEVPDVPDADEVAIAPGPDDRVRGARDRPSRRGWGRGRGCGAGRLGVHQDLHAHAQENAPADGRLVAGEPVRRGPP